MVLVIKIISAMLIVIVSIFVYALLLPATGIPIPEKHINVIMKFGEFFVIFLALVYIVIGLFVIIFERFQL